MDGLTVPRRLSTSVPTCQYHGPRFLATDRDRHAEMRAAGWRRTRRFGWVCPRCLADHPDLARLAVVP